MKTEFQVRYKENDLFNAKPVFTPLELNEVTEETSLVCEENETSLIWKEKVGRVDHIISLLSSTGLGIALFYFFVFIVLPAGSSSIDKIAFSFPSTFSEVALSLSIFFLISFLLYHVINPIRYLFYQLSLKYAVTKDEIHIRYGFLTKEYYRIQFSEIEKFSLVEYEDSHLSTIFISTKDEHPFKGFDFEDHQLRHCPTMEQIKNGPEVIKMLEKLRLNSMK